MQKSEITRQYLQFIFGLLNRLIEDEQLHFNRRPINYVPLIMDIWRLNNGKQELVVLAAILRQGKSAYQNWCQRRQTGTLNGIFQAEYAAYQGKQHALSSAQYHQLVVYNAFWEFLLMTLSMLLKAGWEQDGIQLLHDQLFSDPVERRHFHELATDQRKSMELSAGELTNILLAAGNMDTSLEEKDEHKIAVITCVNDEAMYQQMVASCQQLDLPAGMELEMLPVRGAVSMCSGYNEGMRTSAAKYKLYLHQDMLLLRQDILTVMLDHLARHDEVGMIGLAGNRYWCENAIWWEDQARYMHVIQRGGSIVGEQRYAVGNMVTDWQPMSMLDGFFLMTQYDIPWREELFHGWHFYDISQCVEFRRKGYQIEVPRQEEPWCIHYCGAKDLDLNYHYWRQIFLYHYRRDLAEWKKQ